MVIITNSKEARQLKKMSIEQLKVAETKLKDAGRAFEDKICDHQAALWKLKDCKEKLGELKALVRTIMGKKRGEHCLALCHDNQGNWTCKAKKERYWFRQKHDVFETSCARCRYKVKTKRDKMVFGGIFNTPP